jgi:hypothetical protein
MPAPIRPHYELKNSCDVITAGSRITASCVGDDEDFVTAIRCIEAEEALRWIDPTVQSPPNAH